MLLSAGYREDGMQYVNLNTSMERTCLLTMLYMSGHIFPSANYSLSWNFHLERIINSFRVPSNQLPRLLN